MALGLFDLLPEVEHLVRRVRFGAAKDVLVAEDHLVGDGRGHIPDGEVSVFAGDLRVQDDLQKHVAQLFAQMRHVASLDGVNGLVGFLDHVVRDALVRLLAIPWTSARGAEDADDAIQFVKAVAFQLCQLALRGHEQAEAVVVSGKPVQFHQRRFCDASLSGAHVNGRFLRIAIHEF